MTRRRLLMVAALVPTALAVDRLTSVVGSMAADALILVRPPAGGTSATRCAQCGSSDHAMLDPTCPAAPRVLA